jgi:peptide/nickel transport system permease protein
MRYAWRKTLHGLLLILGVTLVSFVLMVWFGPDQTYNLIGKNATAEQIAEVRHQLGYDLPFHQRYFDYVKELLTLNLGASNSTGEQVSRILRRTFPISLALMLPGFIIGNLLGIALGLLAAYRHGQWSDRLINGMSIAGMSISFLIIIR